MNQTFSTRREFNTPIPPTGAFVYYRLEVKIHAVQTIGASDLILDLFCFIVPQVPAESGFGSIGRKKQSGEFGEAATRELRLGTHYVTLRLSLISSRSNAFVTTYHVIN